MWKMRQILLLAAIFVISATSAAAQSREDNKVDLSDSKTQPITVEFSEEKKTPESADSPAPPDLSEAQTKYVGNKFSQKYHLKGCYFAQIARPENIFPFASCKEAIKSKYRPCNWCLPKWQKFVKGRIIEKSGNSIKENADDKKSPEQ